MELYHLNVAGLFYTLYKHKFYMGRTIDVENVETNNKKR